jgi:Flp pilus assembly protein protease CpaA
MLAFALLFYISYRDLKSHTISNLSLAILLLVNVVCNYDSLNIRGCAITFLIGLILYMKLGLGGGDVKLAAILALNFIPIHRVSEYWMIFALFSLVSIGLKYLCRQTLRGDIPLAPMLCGAVLYIHLAPVI